MLNAIAAAMIAAAQPAAPADTHAQHGHQQRHEQHQGMKCCEKMKSDPKMDCCKDMADAAKAKGCCGDQGKDQGEHKHQ